MLRLSMEANSDFIQSALHYVKCVYSIRTAPLAPNQVPLFLRGYTLFLFPESRSKSAPKLRFLWKLKVLFMISLTLNSSRTLEFSFDLCLFLSAAEKITANTLL
ncbi:hypothetical protein CDAR_191271 [Caerostris darwini]|uniref:Uncharacterized protein n=1 Tax=Caerostris darwini TaxID=1538125 RepID=A0AAV4WZB0_9ARAC|nr:hypothetical protein CDAR_191271 [Caerostris darwini]